MVDIIQPISDYIADSLLTTQGDIIQRGASDAERLAIGAALDVLQVNAAANALAYKGLDEVFQKAKVAKSNAQTISTGTATTVQFNNVIADGDSIWDAGNYRFVPTRAGTYWLIACVEWNTTALAFNMNIGFRVTGAFEYYLTFEKEVASGNNHCTPVIGFSYANGSTDWFDVQVYHAAGASQAIGSSNNSNYFCVFGPI